MRHLRSNWKLAALLVLPIILGVTLERLKAVHDRAYVPLQNVILPKPYHIGQSAAALAFASDNQRLAVADMQTQLWIYNLTTKKFERHFKYSHSDDTNSLAWGHSNSLAVSDSQTIRIFQAPQGALQHEIWSLGKNRSSRYELDHYAQSVVSPQGTLAAFGQVHGAIAVWNAITGQHYFSLKAPQRETCGLAFSPNDEILAVASLIMAENPSPANPSHPIGIEIALRDTRTGKLLRAWRWDAAEISWIISVTNSLGYMGMAFSPDGATLACAADAEATLWDVKSGKLIRNLAAKSVQPWGSRKWLAFSPSGSCVAGLGWGDNIYVWSAKTGLLLQVFHGSPFNNALAFSPNGKLLATGGQDHAVNGVVKLWDVQNLN